MHALDRTAEIRGAIHISKDAPISFNLVSRPWPLVPADVNDFIRNIYLGVLAAICLLQFDLLVIISW